MLNNFLVNFFFNFSSLDHAFPGQYGFQYPASKAMHGIINFHHHIMFYIVIIIFFVFTLFALILEKFSIYSYSQVSNYLRIKKLYNVDLSHNSTIEIIWILVPTIILFFIAIPSFSLLYSFETYTDCQISVKIIGHQWYWSYECFVKTQLLTENLYYNSRIYDFLKNNTISLSFDSYIIPSEELKTGQLRLLETTNPLVLPVETSIKFQVTADDVIHSWAVPALGLKVDAIPGRINQLYVSIDRPGHFYGQCSEICGVNHGFMPISVYALELDDFAKYFNSVTSFYRDFIYLKHYYLRDSDVLNAVYNVIFFETKGSTDIKLALFRQVFFELITTSFNQAVKNF